MTNHMTKAIEAAAKTLSKESQELDQDNSWDEPPEDWRDSWRDTARETIDAALPHIRAMIAQEILNAILPLQPVGVMHEGENKGLTLAARIAEGSQQ